MESLFNVGDSWCGSGREGRGRYYPPRGDYKIVILMGKHTPTKGTMKVSYRDEISLCRHQDRDNAPHLALIAVFAHIEAFYDSRLAINRLYEAVELSLSARTSLCRL